MTFSWERFHTDCRHVSDASIICGDGVIFTHKLVLATVSKLLEQIFRDIPAADEVTLYLKTFEKSEVEEFFSDLFHKKDGYNSELFSTFGVNTYLKLEPHSDSIIKDISKTDEQTNNVEVQEENAADDSRTLALEHKVNFEQVEVKKIQEDIDKVTEEKVKEFEKELIINPKSKKDFVHNRKVNKKIKYEKAIAFFKSGKANSLYHAAQKCEVNDQTLTRLVKTGVSFRGSGDLLKRFSKEEEKVIVQKVLELSSSEENVLTYKLLQKVILEEADVVKYNQPERSDEMLFTTTSLHSFAQALALRHGISDRVNSHIRRDLYNRRTYECEICQSSFTYQNTLVKHRKTSHSFLFQ